MNSFIAEVSQHGSVTLLFEKGMYSLMDDLERIVTVLRQANEPFAVVGGVAVNGHLMKVKRSRSFVTRDIDLLVQRRDLEKIVTAALPAGYAGKRSWVASC